MTSKKHIADSRRSRQLVDQDGHIWVRLGEFATTAHRNGYSSFGTRPRGTARGQPGNACDGVLVSAQKLSSSLKVARSIWIKESSIARKEDASSTLQTAIQMVQHADQSGLQTAMPGLQPFHVATSALPGSAHQPPIFAALHAPTDAVAKDQGFGNIASVILELQLV